MYKTSFANLPEEKLFDGKVLRKVFETRNIEIVSYVYLEGAHFPDHRHPEEQITIVESGSITFILDGKKLELKAGDICYIPPNVPHSAKAYSKREVRTLNVFYPSRKTRP